MRMAQRDDHLGAMTFAGSQGSGCASAGWAVGDFAAQQRGGADAGSAGEVRLRPSHHLGVRFLAVRPVRCVHRTDEAPGTVQGHGSRAGGGMHVSCACGVKCFCVCVCVRTTSKILSMDVLENQIVFFVEGIPFPPLLYSNVS